MSAHNIYRDGQVHVLAEECRTCIFRPSRPVSGSRVAEMVRETKDDDGSTVVCHSTLYRDVDNAICRGWWDRFARDDAVCRLAIAVDVVVEDPAP